MALYRAIARKIPALQTKLRQAGMDDDTELYIKKIAFTSVALSLGLGFVLFTFMQSLVAFVPSLFLVPLMFLYLLKYVDLKILKIQKKIDEEIIFAGRFLIIAVQSGVPIHKAFEDLRKNYDIVGAYFGDILDKTYLGTNFEDAINETLVNSPSPNLRRILWQVLNSIKTGSDIGPSLNSVVDQIMREQQIAVQEYGKKLSPLAMFYLMISIIMPSLGITMLVILATFLGLRITMPFFIVITVLIALIQFIFLSMIRTSRPPISTE